MYVEGEREREREREGYIYIHMIYIYNIYISVCVPDISIVDRVLSQLITRLDIISIYLMLIIIQLTTWGTALQGWGVAVNRVIAFWERGDAAEFYTEGRGNQKRCGN